MNKDIQGEKIRWLFFNVPIYCLIMIFFMITIISLTTSISNGDFDFSEWADLVLTAGKISVAYALPFIISVILNRLFIGIVVCILNDDGIYYRDGFIKWDEIIKIEYEIVFPNRRKPHFCHARIITNNNTIQLVHAPLYLISKIRKMKPQIEAKVTKSSIFFVCLFIAFVLFVSIFIPFIS